jgi:hypothetical protein
VRIADDDLGRARFKGGLDGGVYFLCHKLAEALILKALRPELLARDDAGDAFHVR